MLLHYHGCYPGSCYVILPEQIPIPMNSWHCLETLPTHTSYGITKDEGPFADLFNFVDNTMKDRVSEGLGVVCSSTPITIEMENQRWQSGVLGEHTPTQLMETVLFLIGINSALRGGAEHKRLRRPGYDPQIVNHVDNDGHKCLKFTDDAQSRTNQGGGLTSKFHAPKVVHCYPNENSQKCLYRLYNKYINLLPVNGKSKSLYLYGRHKPLPSVWYKDRPMGINSIRPVINRLCM